MSSNVGIGPGARSVTLLLNLTPLEGDSLLWNALPRVKTPVKTPGLRPLTPSGRRALNTHGASAPVLKNKKGSPSRRAGMRRRVSFCLARKTAKLGRFFQQPIESYLCGKNCLIGISSQGDHGKKMSSHPMSSRAVKNF